MKLITEFINFLLSEEKKPSPVTIKNYKADVERFVKWFEKEFNSTFDPSKITSHIIEIYKKSFTLSPASVERHMSSLRKFLSFLKTKGFINLDLLKSQNKQNDQSDPWKLKNFKNYLYLSNKSSLTIKNYIADIQSYLKWIKTVFVAANTWDLSEKNLFTKINFSTLEEYKQRLLANNFSPRTINRKLSSLRQYINWLKKEKLVGDINFQKIQSIRESDLQIVRLSDSPEIRPSEFSEPSESKYSPFPPLRLLQKSTKGLNAVFDNFFIYPFVDLTNDAKYFIWKISGKNIFVDQNPGIKLKIEAKNLKKEFYAPLSVSHAYFPIHKKVLHYIRYTRPKWYRTYHSYSISHYLHFAILVVTMSAIGFGIYTDLFQKAQSPSTALAALPSIPRLLSFQGKLTNTSNTPIKNPASVSFSIYNNPNSKAKLWEEKNLVTPNQDGVFSVLLGEKSTLSQNLFTQNPNLYLGIQVADSSELLPRTRIPTIPFAITSQTLQGLEPITSSDKAQNVILALDSSGNLNIGGANSHSFQAISSRFVLSGNILTLATVEGSNSDVQIAPDGLGKIDFQKPIHNSSNNNNISSALGAVEFDDLVAILATSSGQSAFTIDQNSTGPLISASTSGTAKFTVENDGSGMFAGDLAVNGRNLTSSATTFNLLNGSLDSLNIGQGANLINIGSPSAVTAIRSGLFVTGNTGIGVASPSAKFEVAGGQTKLEISTQYSERLCHSGSDGTSTQRVILGDCSGGGADLAEYYGSENKTIEAGDIVVAIGGAKSVGQNSKAYVNKSSSPYQGSVIGIVSTNPYDSFGRNFDRDDYAFPVALSGRVPLKASFENGPISAGDLLTSSSIPGVAMRATKAGVIVGKALEDINSIDESKIAGFYDSQNKEYRSKADLPTNITIKSSIIPIVKIYTFVNISWHDPDAYLTSTGDLQIAKKNQELSQPIIHDSLFMLQSSIGEAIERVGAFAELAVANLKAGLVNASEITTNSLVVGTDNIIVGGQKLKDYVTQVINESGIISSVTKTEQIATNIISPLSQDSNISISLHDSQFMIHDSNNATSPAVATIDNRGNASFSGTLASNTLETNEATVSGTLRAGKIIADSIDYSQPSTLSPRGEAGNFQLMPQLADVASFSASLAHIENFSSAYGKFSNGLMVFGPTSLADLSIATQLSIGGSMFLAENSINALGSDLSLQSLRQGGLSIMGGLIYVDTDGNLKIGGDVSVKGKLAVNIISPLPDADLVVNNASGAAVISVNQRGDLVASGSATFNKLNLSLVQPALAVSENEIIATGSAGTAVIKTNQTELTIKNSLVTDKSLIYITPVGAPSAQTPFLLRQLPNESFTVGVGSQTLNPLPFNWLIVN